ncbi:MAG: hypothetical protein ABIG39_03495 [Candidatus Micrarchaeota archaeon]
MKSEDLAYFIGVLHSDGCIFTYSIGNKTRHRYILDVGKKSLPMLKKIKYIFHEIFGRTPKVRKKLHKNEKPTFLIEVNIGNLKDSFTRLKIDKEKLAPRIKENQRFFCAYLAGVIDGDGDISLKRPKYPQCRIRITAGEELPGLMELIRRHLKCSCGLEKAIVSTHSLPRPKKKFGVGYRHCFYVSQKNRKLFKKFVLPHINIKHKRRKLLDFYKLQEKRAIRCATGPTSTIINSLTYKEVSSGIQSQEIGSTE